MLDDLASSAADGAEARPSALDRAALLAVLKTWFRDDAAHSAQWRTTARDDFDFIANRCPGMNFRASSDACRRTYKCAGRDSAVRCQTLWTEMQHDFCKRRVYIGNLNAGSIERTERAGHHDRAGATARQKM